MRWFRVKKGWFSIPTKIKVCTLIPCNQVEVSLINHGRSPFPCYSVQGNKTLFNVLVLNLGVCNFLHKNRYYQFKSEGFTGFCTWHGRRRIDLCGSVKLHTHKTVSTGLIRMHLARNSCTYGISKSKSYYPPAPAKPFSPKSPSQSP